MEAGRNVKEKGEDNNLLELIAADEEFPMGIDELKEAMKPEKYVGRSVSQVKEFIEEVVQPVLDANKDILGMKAEINV